MVNTRTELLVSMSMFEPQETPQIIAIKSSILPVHSGGFFSSLLVLLLISKDSMLRQRSGLGTSPDFQIFNLKLSVCWD